MKRWVICQDMAGSGYAYYNSDRNSLDSTDATLFKSRENAQRALDYILDSNSVPNLNNPEILELDHQDIKSFFGRD